MPGEFPMTRHSYDTPLPMSGMSDVSSLIENAVEGIFRTSPEGRYLLANRALAAMYRYDSVQEMLSRVTDISSQLYVDPQRRQRFRFLLSQQDVLEGFEAEVWCKDRTSIWVREKARVVRSDSGAPLWYEGFVENISEERRSRQTVARWERATASLSDALAVFSADGAYIIGNPAFQLLFPLQDGRFPSAFEILACCQPRQAVVQWHDKHHRWFSCGVASEEQVLLQSPGSPERAMRLCIRPIDTVIGLNKEVVMQFNTL
jgi:PAS domain S-box-containing protein